jgi:autotransporter-associated beta strand protein/YVTN family beta-propeller protein
MLTNQAGLSLLEKELGSNLSGIVPLIRGYNHIKYKCMIRSKNFGERTIMNYTYRPAGSFAGQSPRSRAGIRLRPTNSLTNNAIELNAVKPFQGMRYVAYMFCLGAALASGQAHAQAGQLLYVSNNASNSISVYQTNADGSLTAVTTIAAIGTQPRGIAVRGDQAFAYVALNGPGVNQVKVIDTSTNTVVQTVATGASPFGIAVSPDGTRVYAANNNGNSVSVFSADSVTGQLSALTTITVGNQPRSIKFNSDGSRAYIANQSPGSGSVSVVDTATNSVIATINTGGQLTDLAINPDGTRIYASDTGNKVYVINTATNTVVATPTATLSNPSGIAVSADGTRFYVANINGHNISQFDAATNTSLGTVVSNLNPAGMALSPDGTFVYVAKSGSNNVGIYSISSGLLTEDSAIAAGTSPFAVGLCGNGSGMLGSGKTFVANSAGALGCTGSSASFSGGTLKINTASLSSSQVMSLGTAGGIIDTNGNSATLSGIVSGSGGLTKSGSGTLTLSGANTYSGGTTINAGTLSVGADNNLGTGGGLAFGGGTLQYSNGFSSSRAVTLNAGGGTFDTNGNNAILSGIIGGTGGLTKSGTGTLTLSGANTYSGGTTVNAGTLQAGAANVFGNNSAMTVASGAVLDLNSFNQTLGSLAGASNVTLGTATLTAGGDNTSTTFSGVISGAGSLVKSGTGTLTLSGSNTYSGATAINAGTLRAGAANAFSSNSASTVAAGATLDFNGFNQTLGSLAGTGNMALGAATLTIGGDNTDTTFSGVTSGTGSLIKNGTGKTILSGTNTYTGDTQINGGILSVNGSTTSNALVNSGGTLGGSGTIGGNVTVNSGGVIAPGNSPGILTVNNLTLASGSTTRMEINGLTAGTQYDQIVVNNTATLGGTLDLVFGFTPSAGNRFALIRAGNIASGFATIQSNISTTLGAALQLRTISSPTAFDLLIDQGSFMPFALTHNQQAVASMLDAQYAAWGATGLINRLDTLSAAQLPAILASLSGEQHTHGQFMARRLGMQFNDLLLSRLNDVDDEQAHGWHFWMKGLGGFGAIEGDGNAGRADNHSGGFAMGADTGLGERATLGAAVSYVRSNVDAVTANLGMDSYQLSSYGKWQRDGNYLEGTVTGGLHQTDSRRTVFENSAAADYDSSTAGTALEAGRHIALPGTATLTPYAGMQYLHLNRDGFSETGSALANLNVREANEDSFRTLLGARLSQVVKAGWGVSIQPMLHAAWVRENADSFSRLSADFAAAPAAAYSVYGPKLKRNRAAVGADLVTRFSETAQLNVAYNAELAKSDDWHTLSATFEYRW